MLAHTHHTTEENQEQALALVNHLWETEVVPQLPADLEEQAKKHKAFQRQRQVANAYDLLRAILGYVLGGLSTRQWGAWAVIIGLADISDRAWSKRLQQSGAWLLWLFGELTALETGAVACFGQTGGRVLLIDASTLKQVGGSGDDWRLHTAYDLIAGRLAQVVVTDHTQGEKLDHFELEVGDIAVSDGGYGYRSSVAAVKKKQADGVFRIHPDTFPLEDKFGQPLDLWPLLRKTKGPRMWERQAYCIHNQQRYAVRVIACKLPPEQAGLARKRAEKRAQKKGRPVSLNSLVLAGWVLLITTLEATDWSTEDILRLYRVRWQIELLFKRMKQMLKMHHIQCKRQDSVQATIRALLLAWVLQEQQATQVRSLLQQLIQSALSETIGLPVARPISSWSIAKLCLQTLRQQVLGQWSMARLRACLPRLQRFLTGKRRHRGHQETDVRRWLEHRSMDQSQPLEMAA
jgi:Transposase DDE domain